jgi:hypothetical protein
MMHSFAPRHLNLSCMQGKSPFYGNKSIRPVSNLLICRIAIKLYSRSLAFTSCTRRERATWRLLLSNHKRGFYIPSNIRHTCFGDMLDIVVVYRCCAGRYTRPQTPLATCLVDARAPMTHSCLPYGPRSPSMVTMFTATPWLCYFKQCNTYVLYSPFQVLLKVCVSMHLDVGILRCLAWGMKRNISACWPGY